MSDIAMLRQLPFVPNLHFLVMLVTIALSAHLRGLEAAKSLMTESADKLYKRALSEMKKEHWLAASVQRKLNR